MNDLIKGPYIYQPFHLLIALYVIKRLLTLLLLAGLGTGPALAQAQGETLESQQFKQRLRGQFLRNDTAQAIITLYSRRQAGGVGWIIGSLLSAVRIGTAGGGSSNYGGYAGPSDSGSNMGAALLVSVPLVAYGVGKLAHYSNAHLNQVLTAYGAGQPLPRSLRRKLKPRFFQEPIVKYQKVKYKAAN